MEYRLLSSRGRIAVLDVLRFYGWHHLQTKWPSNRSKKRQRGALGGCGYIARTVGCSIELGLAPPAPPPARVSTRIKGAKLMMTVDCLLMRKEHQPISHWINSNIFLIQHQHSVGGFSKGMPLQNYSRQIKSIVTYILTHVNV